MEAEQCGDTVARDPGKRRRQYNGGKRYKYIAYIPQRHLYGVRRTGRKATGNNPYRSKQRDHRKADAQGITRAVYQPRQDAPAQLVRTERVPAARLAVLVQQILFIWVVGREQRRKHRRQQKQHDHGKANDGLWIPKKTSKHAHVSLLPVHGHSRTLMTSPSILHTA